MQSICTFDDTLPLPDDVGREYHAHPGGDVKAWLTEHSIDAEPIGKVIEYGMVWNPAAGRYDFKVYGPDHVGPKHAPELAVPIVEDGKFVDLLFISESMSFARATCRAKWLGTIEPTTRLHAHPLDFIAAGCTGVCHIEPISRKALKELRAATTIECNDLHTALQAWDWGFGGEDEELARFSIDDTPDGIRSYLETDIRWRRWRTASEAQA
jgi:hypothetical protein